MTEQEQLQRLKAFVCDVVTEKGDIETSFDHIHDSAVANDIILFEKDYCPYSGFGMKRADWLQPTTDEIDEIIKQGGGPV
ncbi:MAG: hypothetical protein H6937_02185 [Burkholderiales bacterium]|nr:hypothetical protein [Burkholderiales bacterium]